MTAAELKTGELGRVVSLPAEYEARLAGMGLFPGTLFRVFRTDRRTVLLRTDGGFVALGVSLAAHITILPR